MFTIKKKKGLFVKTGIVSIVLSCMVAMVNTLFIDRGTMAVAENSSVQGSFTQEILLSNKNAILQNYSKEDLIATESFLLNRPYEGNGRVIDADEDGRVDVFDLCIMRQEYQETGNYYHLLTKLINDKAETCTTTSSTGAISSNRVIVRTEREYDFSPYNTVALLSGDDYEYILQFDNLKDTETCISDLQNKKDVLYAVLDDTIFVPIDEIQYEEEISSANSVMLKTANSWGFSEIEADKYASYLSQNFSNHITVAVIDTGVSNHEFLNNRLLNGYNVINDTYNVTDDVGHGTHVAGTIVDCTPGLNIDILPIRVMKGVYNARGEWTGSGNTSVINAGIDKAVELGADIINMSLGGPNPDSSMEYHINQAINSGVTVVVSAGNESTDTKTRHPANMTNNCIVVSAVDKSMKRAYFSNYGQSVDVAAPGVNIKSCIPNNIKQATYYGLNYDSWNGTSMAAPHISAAVAMIKYSGIATTPSKIESTLISTCTDLGTPGYDVYYGHGIPKLSKLIKSTVKPSISLSKTSASAYVGDTIQLSASCTPSDANVVWSSSNASVATVSNGKVVARGAGNATIIASFVYEGQTYSASCSVSVKAVKIDLNETNKTVYQTDEFNLSAKTEPANLVVSWSSSNSSVASVSNGKVTAINPGTATITASITYAGRTYSSSCNVTVKKVSVELNPKSLSILIGDISKINATTSPSGLSVSWSTSNNMVASINNGSVTANAPGNITITASMMYNGKQYTDTCAVTVKEPSINLVYSQLKMAKNETITMLANTSPSGQSINWSSEDTSICTISSSGVITAKSIGNTMITGTITYAGATYSSSCNVIVGEPKVTLSKTNLSMYVSDTQSLVASVIAVDGSNITSETKSDISWSSSNSSVATVDSNGAVKAVATGTATITAKYTFCGINYTATCSVTVQGKPTISLNKSSLSLYIGDTSTLSTTVTPSGQTVSWSTSNSSVAMVNNGKITAISNGTATITASFRYNGVNYSTTCTVTVKKPSISVSISSSSIWLGDTTYVSKSGSIPSGATVSWTSSNSSVATVNSSGTVTGVGDGTATITGSFTYGGNKYSSSTTVKVITLNSVRTFTVSPSSGSNGSTTFAFNANVGFVADKVTIQVCSTNKALQSNGSYDYTTYTNEIPIHKSDASHWYYNTTLTGFSSGSYLVRCRAYNGSSSVTAYVNLTIK